MPIDVPALVTFNRGIVSPKALARVDIQRVGLSAEEQTNWMPRVLGNMSLRPGMKYLGATKSDAAAVFAPFVYAADDTALLEFTNQVLRVWDGDTETLAARGSASATISNGTFDSDLASWTDADESGATSAWVTGGYMGLTGTGFAAAIRRQQVTTSSGGSPHAIRVVVTQGPVTIKIGSSAGLDDYGPATLLRTGTFSLSFTPAGNFWVEFSSVTQYQALVDSAVLESSGTMELPTPWLTADLGKLRFAQSRDVVFVAADGYPPYRIERYGLISWGVVLYQPENGPMQTENTGPITLTPSALTGTITLTASKALFSSSKVGALYSLTSFGQQVEATFTAEDQWSDPIRVTGTGSQRRFEHVLTNLTGTSTTVTLQRSVNEPGAWIDINDFTTDGTRTYNDGLDNQTMYYRLGVKTGDYSSGTISLAIDFATSGTITGYVRITAVASSTSATAIVLKALGGTTGTSTWAEGEWSASRGYPTAVGFFEGRLWWFGQDRIWGSVSDAFDNFDADTEGDSGPIARNIADGPTDIINWMLPGQRLLLGGQSATFSVRSSSLDEPITPSAFSLKRFSTQGSAAVAAVPLDTGGFYVQANGKRVYEIGIESNAGDYGVIDATALVPEVGGGGISRLAVQRQPDTRVHAVRSDGKVAVLVFDRLEEVRCWMLIEAGGSGIVEDVVILPGTDEDRVFYIVKRTIDSSTVRYLEKWATEDEAAGATATALVDSYVQYSGAATTTVTAAHLEGEDIVVWADGNSVDDENGDPEVFTVSSGTVTLPASVTSYTAGLAYTARFKSAKLAYAAPFGTALGMRKRISKIGLILADTHCRGLRYGPSFDVLDDLPAVEVGADVAAGTIHTAYDEDQIEFPGEWGVDSRICLEAASPRPATVMAVTFLIEGHR